MYKKISAIIIGTNNLFGYGDHKLSHLILPKLKELVITLTPKLRSDHVDWHQMDYFKATNLKNLCLIFHPTHLFDVVHFAEHFRDSVQNVIIISKLYDHQDTLRFVNQMEKLVDTLSFIQSLWIKVDDWIVGHHHELELMLDRIRRIQSVVFRVSYNQTQEKHVPLYLHSEWNRKQYTDDVNGQILLEISKNKNIENNDWIQFVENNMFDKPHYFAS